MPFSLVTRMERTARHAAPSKKSLILLTFPLYTRPRLPPPPEYAKKQHLIFTTSNLCYAFYSLPTYTPNLMIDALLTTCYTSNQQPKGPENDL